MCTNLPATTLLEILSTWNVVCTAGSTMLGIFSVIPIRLHFVQKSARRAICFVLVQALGVLITRLDPSGSHRFPSCFSCLDSINLAAMASSSAHSCLAALELMSPCFERQTTFSIRRSQSSCTSRSLSSCKRLISFRAFSMSDCRLVSVCCFRWRNLRCLGELCQCIGIVWTWMCEYLRGFVLISSSLLAGFIKHSDLVVSYRAWR
jgi:hypothetical protein